MEAIIGIAHVLALDLAVMAEGVETQSHLDFLRELGCDSAQGWLFSKAAPAEDLEAMLSPGDRS